MAEDNKGIFISYRRATNASHAGWLGDTLSEHFGEHKVFRDIDSIEPGLDFVETIKRALDSSEVLIAQDRRFLVRCEGCKGPNAPTESRRLRAVRDCHCSQT